MACKRPGVRVPLAPLHFKAQISNTEPVVATAVEGRNEGQAPVSDLGWLTSTDRDGGCASHASVGFDGLQQVISLQASGRQPGFDPLAQGLAGS
jgi:hypothetical protein